MRQRRGFTLIELLVVVAIITSLIAILLPALSKSRQTAKEVTCGVDIRMMTVTCLTYANEEAGWFPQLQNTGSGSSTQPYPYWSYPYWRRLLESNYGIQRNHWESPTNETWNDDELYYWGWDGTDPDTATHMVYARFYFGTANLVDRDAFKAGVVDPTISTDGRIFRSKANQKASVDLLWTDLNRSWGGLFFSGGNRFGANHMYSPGTNKPDGNHLGHVDGSVEWATRDEIKIRIQYPTPSFADLYW